MYDRLVERRQQLVLRRATQTNNIVASLFPENVRDRLIQQAEDAKNKDREIENGFLTKQNPFDGSIAASDAATPIADLFPDCTVL